MSPIFFSSKTIFFLAVGVSTMDNLGTIAASSCLVIGGISAMGKVGESAGGTGEPFSNAISKIPLCGTPINSYSHNNYEETAEFVSVNIQGSWLQSSGLAWRGWCGHCS